MTVENTDYDSKSKWNVSKNTRRTFLAATGSASALGLAGCMGSIGGGGSGGPIKIGGLGPLTSTLGEDLKTGTQMAVDDLNSNGGINGRDVKLIMEDTQNDPSVAKKKYTSLTLDQNVDVTMGGWLGAVINVIMEGMKDSETLHICSAGAAIQPNKLIQQDYETYKYWFRVAENSWTSAENRFSFIQENWKANNWNKIAVMYEDLAYNKPQQDYFDKHFPDIGAEKVMSVRYPSGTKDFSSLFDKAESAGADLLYGAMAVGGTPAVTQWNKQQRPFQLAGTVSAAQRSSYYKDVNGNAQYFVPSIAAVPGVSITDLTVDFQNRFNDKSGHYPLLTGYYGYMAVNAFAQAAKSAGTAEDDDKLVSAMENLKMKTLLGTLEFFPKSNRSVHDAIQDKDHIYWQFFQWDEKNGSPVQKSIWPDRWATGQYQAPPWL